MCKFQPPPRDRLTCTPRQRTPLHQKAKTHTGRVSFHSPSLPEASTVSNMVVPPNKTLPDPWRPIQHSSLAPNQTAPVDSVYTLDCLPRAHLREFVVRQHLVEAPDGEVAHLLIPVFTAEQLQRHFHVHARPVPQQHVKLRAIQRLQTRPVPRYRLSYPVRGMIV